MKNLLVILSVLVLVTACQPNQSEKQSSVTTDRPSVSTDADATSDADDQVPVEALTFETNISTEGMSVEQEMEIRKAEDIIKLVIASEEFKSRILNHTVNGVKTFLNNNGLSNEEIYQRILDQNVMDLAVELIPKKTTLSSRIFQIIAGIKKIFFFLNLFQNTTPAGIAQNLFQQWLGNIGFGLTEGASSNLTVQQAVARIIGELGKKHL